MTLFVWKLFPVGDSRSPTVLLRDYQGLTRDRHGNDTFHSVTAKHEVYLFIAIFVRPVSVLITPSFRFNTGMTSTNRDGLTLGELLSQYVPSYRALSSKVPRWYTRGTRVGA